MKKVAFDRDERRRFVVENGCFPPEENERIFHKWFEDAPRYLFRVIDEKYGLTGMKVCDLGCSYGTNLFFCSNGSYGIETNPDRAAFARSLSLEVHEVDFASANLSELPKVEAVWCSAVLEHVDAPHVFLRRIHQLLVPNGLLALYVPTVPSLSSLKPHRLPWVGRYFAGHLASDHVNAFTASTLRFFCERAGFRTLDVSPCFPRPFSIFNHVPVLSTLFDGCVYVGRALTDWEYYPRATRRSAETPLGYTRK